MNVGDETWLVISGPVESVEPERCPTCGSDDPKVQRFVRIGGKTLQPRRPCPDPWHQEDAR